MKIDRDRLFKLLSTFFFEFLDLFLPEVVTYIEPKSLTLCRDQGIPSLSSGFHYVPEP